MVGTVSEGAPVTLVTMFVGWSSVSSLVMTVILALVSVFLLRIDLIVAPGGFRWKRM